MEAIRPARTGVRHGERTATVVATISARIASRALTTGDRLPSIRQLATSLGVAPATVVEAYDRLVADGVIRARRGAGFYVAAAATAPRGPAERAEPVPRAIDPFWVSRQSLDAEPGALRPGCGWLPPAWMPEPQLRRALRAVARGDEAVLVDYGPTRGSAGLRRQLQARLLDEGIDIPADRLLLTGSGTQAIDLILRLLLRPGATVLVDDPCYFNFRALLEAHRADIVGVPFTATGPDPAEFERIVAARRPCLYLTTSTLHNPTGTTLPLRTAHRLLSIAARHDLVIVEDDIFGDLATEPIAKLAGLDGLERVIRIGSFSKTLSASLRCGYIAARRDWIEALLDLQVATSFGGPSPVAVDVIGQVLASGGYRRHLADLHRRLARARREVALRLERLGLQLWTMPRGGFFLWCRLPGDLDSAAVARAAVDEGLLLAPGNVFSISNDASAWLRFNVAQSLDPRVDERLRRALAAATRAAA